MTGRWSLVTDVVRGVPGATERAHALAAQLLDRHGVVTREAALAEGTPGGFAAVYPVLKLMEETGAREVRVRVGTREVAARLLPDGQIEQDMGEVDVGEPDEVAGVRFTPVCVGNVDAHVTAAAVGGLVRGEMLAIMGTSTCHILDSDRLASVPGICGVVRGGIHGLAMGAGAQFIGTR